MTISQSSMVTPTRATQAALCAIVFTVLATGTFLMARYPSLPELLPVRFSSNGAPNRWQFRTPARVLAPVLVQTAMAVTLGAIGLLLLSRPRRAGTTDAGPGSEDGPDVKAAAVAAEAVIGITLVWVVFQGYGAWALMQMWMAERAGLGASYYALEVAGVLMTIVVAVRAHRRLGRPEPKPYRPEHWRLGQLYKNAEDPALFVPTRDGRRWTLNFGRPVAAALLGLILLIGVLGPTIILALMLRWAWV